VASAPHTEYVDVRVDRAGKEFSIRLPCRDDRPEWEASAAIWRAIDATQWQDCVEAVSRRIEVTGVASAGVQNVAILCMREKSRSEKQRVPDEVVSRLRWK
jgi:hypothetical protein